MEPPNTYSKSFLPFWGSNGVSPGRREEDLPRGLWDVATDVYSVVKWLFEAFRNNFIVCYLSSHISEADRSIEVTVPKILDRWFKATEIPFSNRLNPLALIEGLRQVDLPFIIAAFDEKLSSEMSAEVFVRDHVMNLAEGMTKKIPNPANGFAFWLSTQDLKGHLQTLEESVLRDLMSRMGSPSFEVDSLVMHCRDKMHLLKAQLEQLLPSD